MHFESLHYLAINSIGLNTDIFDTNIINLSIVLGVVIVFGGDALREALDQRRLTVLSNFEEANSRFTKAQAELKAASDNLEQQKQEAKILCTETAPKMAERETTRIQENTLSEITRLEQRKDADIELARNQASSFIYQSVMKSSLSTASEMLTKMFANGKSQENLTTIMNNSIQTLTNLQPSNVESMVVQK